ncbi:MAG: efflux RND transporter permease subunit [Thermoanaerobaculia bacterium]
MNPVRRWLSAPHLLLAVTFTAAALGVFALFRMPVNLFPDSERPQAAVVTVWPGASAADVEADVTRVIETEIAGADLVRQVLSTSRDEVSVVTGEFTYEKDLDTAASDAAAAIDRVAAQLPPGVQPPQVFRISSATAAVMTLALRPAEGSPLDLSMVRQLAENDVRDRLQAIPQVARVEVFGGHRPVARVEPDPVRLAAHGLTVDELARTLAGRARNQPYGALRDEASDTLVVRLDARSRVEELARVVIATPGGGSLRLEDVATVERGEEEPTAVYHADGEPAIALAIQRATTGNAVETIEAVSAVLPELGRLYPGVAVSVPDDQGGLITLAIRNMKGSLVGAVVPTLLVLFLFLGDRRVTLLAAISLPLTFLLTFAAMWLLGLELNLVTLTAVIVAVGMLVDNSVVVIENIARHAETGGEAARRDAAGTAAGATSEVALAILGGTSTTVMVLLPILFVGGFVETILRPFALTLILAIVSSYLVAVTVIPLAAPLLLRPSEGRRLAALDRLDRWAGRAGSAVTGAVARLALSASERALRHRALVMLAAVAVLLVSVRQVPLLGRDLMPPMDTGIVKVSFEAAPNTPLSRVEDILGRLEAPILARPEVVSVSSVVGAEPSVTAFGASSTPRQGVITVNLVDRFQRELSIWEIEEALEGELRAVPGLSSLALAEYGATPFSTMKATVDVEVAGPDPEVLDRLAREVERRLREGVRGLTGVRRSWALDTRQLTLDVDAQDAARHGTTPEAISTQVGDLLRGRRASALRLPSWRGLPVVVQLPARERSGPERLAGLQVATPGGPVPLAAVAEVREVATAGVLTRRNLSRTLEVLGTRGRTSVTHLQEDVDAALAGMDLPAGYTLRDQGEIHAMREAFGRLAGALVLSLVLLYGALVPTFRSWTHPLTVMAAIPLAAVGGIWALLVAYKSTNMPAFMGVILLSGVAVNTSILLLDVMDRERAGGAGRVQAIRRAIRRRTRPILMTTFSTMVGMLPVALETAVGLERLSPLAVVAIGGLLVSSFLVLVYVPVVATLLEDGTAALARAGRWLRPGHPAPAPSPPELPGGTP